MAKKRKSTSRPHSIRKAEPKPVFDSPFRNLKKLIKEHSSATAVQSSKVAATITPPAVLNGDIRGTLTPALSRREREAKEGSYVGAQSTADDEALLREALDGVRPIGGMGPERIAAQPLVMPNVVSEDAEVLAELSDLISGQGAFELTETEEYLEGARVGLDPRLVSRLRRGDFSMQAHIDLHGMTQVDAKAALTEFILESVRKGRRAVLVVHGRGLRSPGGQPVLKHATAQWLSHGTIGGYVLAFTTARIYDGGAGAVWVLLRRERQRGKFDVLRGAKRHD